jgi:hypothetical protein
MMTPSSFNNFLRFAHFIVADISRIPALGAVQK